MSNTYRKFYPDNLVNPETGGGKLVYSSFSADFSKGSSEELKRNMVGECMRTEPPFLIGPDEVEVKHYLGEESNKGFWGVEAKILPGFKLPDDIKVVTTDSNDSNNIQELPFQESFPTIN